MIRLLLLTFVVSGCAQDYTHVSVEFRNGDNKQRQTVTQGANAWEKLGFHAQEGVDGHLHVTVKFMEFEGELARYRGLADRENNHIILSSSLSTLRLKSVAAHEFGHIILDTWKHLEEPQEGVMLGGAGYTSLSSDDLELACNESGLCLE